MYRIAEDRHEMRKHQKPHKQMNFYLEADLYEKAKDHFHPFKLSHVLNAVLHDVDKDKDSKLETAIRKALIKQSRASKGERKRKG